MSFNVTFTQETLCKGSIRTIGEVLNVDDETARMLVDLGVATASGLSPQTGSSAALFSETFLAKTNNLSDVNSPATSRDNLAITPAIESEVATYATPRTGAWSNSTAYQFGDIVSFADGTFICIQDHTNRVPLAEQNYWQQMSRGWSWMVLPWTNIAFANQRTSGTGVDANNNSNTIAWVRSGTSATSTSPNAIALYRVLSTGVPAYPHHYFDDSAIAFNSFNSISFIKAGRFQCAFTLSLSATAGTAGTVFYIDVGRTYSEVGGSGTISPLNAPLDKRGFGIRVVANGSGGLSNAFASFHDGTTYTEVAFDPNIIKGTGGINRLDITWNGLGTMIWFINNVEVHRNASTFTDVFVLPTWGSIAMGIYNAPNLVASQLLWVMAEETGFVTYAG